MLDCTRKFSYTQYMFTLTEASLDTKLILKWGAIILASLFALFFIFKFLVYVKNIFFPTPPPKPTVLYGKLPAIFFPQSITNENFKYSVNTISGELPVFQAIAKVYTMSFNTPDLLALQRAQRMVSVLGFNSTPTELQNNLYEWFSNDKSQKIIRMDTTSNDFVLSGSLTSDPFVVSGVNLPDQQGAIDMVQGALKAMGLMYDDIDPIKSKAVILKMENNKFVQANSISEAKFTRVDLFQKDVDGLPVYYENADKSVMNFLVTGGNSGQILWGNFTHQSPTLDFSTYPLKTTDQAYKDLTSGKAYIANYYGTSQNIQINNMFLAYYIGSSIQSYLMPIFVFQGNNGFYAYVPAITDGWISK